MPATVRNVELTEIRQLDSVLRNIEQAHQNADYTESLKVVLDLLETSHRRFFAGHRDPNGTSWPPLKSATVAKKRHATILVDSGDLLSSLTAGSRGVRETTSRNLTYGTRIPYAIYQQQGTGLLPQRAHVGYAKDALDQTVELVADAAVEALQG